MLNFAIVGYGHIGKRHAEHIDNNDFTKLVAICDNNHQVLGDIKNEHVHIYSGIEEMLVREKDIDVLCVCTPNYLHCQHSVLGLNAGVHVIVEKPMALSTKECELMMKAANDNKKMLFPVKQNRYNPPVAVVKDLITSGRLGSIYMIQVNCFWNRSNHYYQQSNWRGSKVKDGGCLFTQFSHFIDILYYLNGDILSVDGVIHNFAHQHNTEFEDSGIFSMRAKNDALISFSFSTCAFEKNMEGAITVLAEKGTVKIGGQYLNTIEYQSIAGEKLPVINISAKENDYGLYKGSMSNHDKVIQNVVDVLLHHQPAMTVAKEAADVVGIIERMYKSVI